MSAIVTKNGKILYKNGIVVVDGEAGCNCCGVCCLPGGLCSECETKAECLEKNGTWSCAISCDPNPCEGLWYCTGC